MRLFGIWWRVPKLMQALFAIEFLFTVAVLALFGIADPDLYRTKLWQEGSDHGFNSNPNEILYSYANHNPIDTPLVWSKFLNNYNVVIAVLSMFFLLTKTTMHIMNVFWPALSVVIHVVLVALYSFSIYGQSSHDTSGARPWYLTKSCNVASTDTLKGYCEQAKAAFAMTVIMLALFLIHIPYAVWSNFTAKKPLDEEDDDEFGPSYGKEGSPESAMTTEQHWEMQDFRSAGTTGGLKSPMQNLYTPRTQAFHSLQGAQ